jgi:hypothetical protein
MAIVSFVGVAAARIDIRTATTPGGLPLSV